MRILFRSDFQLQKKVPKTLKKFQITDEDSAYQSRLIPIPLFPGDGSDPNAKTFIGRLMNRLVFITDPKFVGK